MPCVENSSRVIVLFSHSTILNTNEPLMTRKCVYNKVCNINLITKDVNGLKIACEPPSCVNTRVPANINMSPNPENIQFLNNIHQQEQEQDDEDGDSGFASGGRICSRTFSCQQDHDILAGNQRELSMCHFYYPDLDSAGAMKMLKHSSIGTFLIRNSADSKFLFSLSVKTQRGATSVRIVYKEGLFSFDCDERIRKRMPQFHSVLSLVDHHVELSRQGINNSWRWEEKTGRKNMVVDISKPCRTSVTSLKHLTTIALNKSLEMHHQILRYPFQYEDILTCIRDYPFKV